MQISVPRFCVPGSRGGICRAILFSVAESPPCFVADDTGVAVFRDPQGAGSACETGRCCVVTTSPGPRASSPPQHVGQVGPVGTRNACPLSPFPALPLSHIPQCQAPDLEASCPGTRYPTSAPGAWLGLKSMVALLPPDPACLGGPPSLDKNV